jgi:GTP-binding protein Era
MSGEAKSVERCGFVAIVGRPNVGKSTLLNRMVGSRLSITARKPHTTRFQIQGILSSEDSQIIFIDTPGLQRKTRNLLGKRMNQEVDVALQGVDIAIQVLEACRWQNAPAYHRVLRISQPIN